MLSGPAPGQEVAAPPAKAVTPPVAAPAAKPVVLPAAAKPAATPAVAKPAAAPAAAKPAAAPATATPAPSAEELAAEAKANEELKIVLNRLVVGNQGAILKIWNVEGGAEPDYYRGLDDRNTAPYSEQDQQALVASLAMSQADLENFSVTVMTAFEKLPKKNVLGFLGFVNSLDDNSPFEPSDEVDAKIREFLLVQLKENKDVVMRRQACLSLAVGDTFDQEILDTIITFYANSENLWETFPVQQYFEYQAKKVSALPNFLDIRTRVEAVQSLYQANILGYLDQAISSTASLPVK